MRGFHFPDALGKPVEKFEVVGLITEKSLAKMNVSLDESRKDVEAIGVDDFRAAQPGRKRATNLGDLAGLDFDVGFEDTAPWILRYQRAIRNPGGHQAQKVSGNCRPREGFKRPFVEE